MLIKFQSESVAPFSMLDDDAKPLLRSMGLGENLEGSISGENLKEAHTSLKSALSKAAMETEADDKPSDEEEIDAETPINMSVRAVPLLDMMNKAQANNSYVMWRPE